uniref:ADP-ribosylation factor-like 14 n=1 Tax=Astyanax mexicanus TaxID=7994 RepID=A0A3B1K7U2_ASTMX
MGLKGSRLPDARVLLLGLDGSGKSTLLYKLKYDERFQTAPTVGFNVEMIDAKQNRKKITVTVWDVDSFYFYLYHTFIFQFLKQTFI